MKWWCSAAASQRNGRCSPLQVITDVTEAEPVTGAGSTISSIPETSPQLLASVMLHTYPFPAGIPLNMPDVFVSPLNVYDRGSVPPPPIIVTVAVPPLHNTGAVTEAEPVTTAGSVTSNVPVAGVQLLTSVMLHAYPVPAEIPLNTPVELVTPLNVYDNGTEPPAPVSVIVAVPPMHRIGVVTDAEPVMIAGSRILSAPVTGPQLFASVMLHAYPAPAGIPLKIPVALVTPLKV